MQAIPIDAEGRFAGYASRFGTLDEGGDVVLPGAFRRSLTRRGRGQVRMLFQHDPKEPIGLWDTIAEDHLGLWVEGRLVGGVPRADALRRLIAARAIDGLSIGFRTVKALRSATSGVRRLVEIDLWEISIVAFPMLDAARIAAASERPVSRDELRLKRSLDAAITALRKP
jgi:HK97 family phage prohead protease